MEKVRIPGPGDIYRHFKDRLYQIITVAVHSETKEAMVVYQALYGDFKIYVRPLKSFIAELAPNEYPQAKQRHRFELVRTAVTDTDENTVLQNDAQPLTEEKLVVTEATKTSPAAEDTGAASAATEVKSKETSGAAEADFIEAYAAEVINSGEKVNNKQPEEHKLSAEGVNHILIQFLEADSYYDKLDIVSSNRKHLTDRLINDMAVAIDCTVEDGPLDERMEGLISCLQAMCRFEQKRSHTAHTRIIK